MTDDEIRERLAVALFHAEDAAGDWDYFSEEFRDRYRRQADALSRPSYLPSGADQTDERSTEVERAARAIWISGEHIRSPWAEISETTRQKHRERAERVLAALRGVCPRCCGEGWTGPADSRPGVTCDDCNGTGRL